jgi:DNA repair protein RadD
LVAGQLVQCAYRWTAKQCPHCEADNDIAARYCAECKGEIVDPNEKLRAAFNEKKGDPTRRQTDKVLNWEVASTISQSGRECWRVNVTTPYRTFAFWVFKAPTWSSGFTDRAAFLGLGGKPPETITYQKDPNTKFYKVHAYNRRADEIPQ